MVYIIGSGFSGLTTAYSLYLKGIKATILSPGEVHKKKFFSLLKYIIKKEGEINSNSNYLTKQIKKVNFLITTLRFIYQLSRTISTFKNYFIE